ncbi:carbohydrate ABC transporter permease [Planctomycetota bacterium]
MKPSAGRQRDLKPALCFLAPNFLGFLVFVAGPVLFSLVVSFTNWDLQRTVPFRFIGLRNFVELARDPEFWLYFVNTAYLMLGMPVAIAGSLMLALLLSQRLRGIVVYRTLFYLPAFTAGVALMILWKALYNPDFGPINAAIEWVLGVLGLTGVGAPQWLLSTRNLLGLDVESVGIVPQQWGVGARDAIIVMGIWIAIGGNNMLLYLAALSNVPQELYEAAQIDGAGKWQTFWNVTWPQLAPTTFFIVVMSFIGGLQGGFEQARVMTAGGPAGTTTTLTYYIYTKAFEEFQIGYASSISWVLFVIIFVVTLVNWRFGTKELSY